MPLAVLVAGVLWGSMTIHVRLATGRWSVRVSVGMRSTPSAVVVRAGAHRLDLTADTGIR
jgi:hypothetical protein